MNMHKLFQPGDEIGGYCNGYFGRDDYDNKTCVLVTVNYALFEYSDGSGVVLNYVDGLEVVTKGDNWKPQ